MWAVSGFTLEQWMLIAAIASLGLLGLLWALSVQIQQHTTLTDLKYQVKVLRQDYTKRLAQQMQDEDDPEAAAAAAMAEVMPVEGEAGVELADLGVPAPESAEQAVDVEEIEPSQAA